MLSSREDFHFDRLADHVRWGAVAAKERLAAGLTASLTPRPGADAEAGALQNVTQMAREQATVLSVADVFIGLAALFAVMVLLTPILQKPQAATAPDAH